MILSTKQKEVMAQGGQSCGSQGVGEREWDGWGGQGFGMQTFKFGMDGQWGTAYECVTLLHQQKLKKYCKSTIIKK